MITPRLKVVGLHIEGLRALRRVDWPADGMGWGGKVPDMVMVGGVNGSGKTTLLDFIGHIARRLQNTLHSVPVEEGTRAWIDLNIASTETGETTLRVLMGDEAFIENNQTEDCVAFSDTTPFLYIKGPALGNVRKVLSREGSFTASDFPSVLYLPTDRSLVIPTEQYKAAGKLEAASDFFFRFQPATKWKQSLEALLYGARWADLNAIHRSLLHVEGLLH